MTPQRIFEYGSKMREIAKVWYGAPRRLSTLSKESPGYIQTIGLPHHFLAFITSR